MPLLDFGVSTLLPTAAKSIDLYRLLHLNPSFQVMAHEEALQPHRTPMGDRSKQVTMVVDDESLVRHSRPNRQGQSSA